MVFPQTFIPTSQGAPGLPGPPSSELIPPLYEALSAAAVQWGAAVKNRQFGVQPQSLILGAFTNYVS